jgi:3-oxoacyl-[acyl-carrier-protein] synthase II
MREPIVITGVGVVSACGVTREAFFEALAAGASGIAEDAALAPTGFPLAARVGDFGIKKHVEPRAVRRLARLSQMALVAAKQALAQAELPAPDPLRTGIVLGTGLGTLRETIDFLAGIIKDGAGNGSPLLFPSSVMNAAAGQMAIELGLRGVNTTVNHREASAFGALALAADLLALGRADALLVGACDELNDWSHHGYRRFGALTRTAMRPYARGRDGAVPGEGAALLLVEREADARRRGARPLARVAGLAAHGDARPRVGWGHDEVAAGAARAITEALAQADLAPARLGWIAGGGAGLPIDALEARTLEAAVARPAGRPVPVSSILAQTGELMTSSMFRLAAAVYALERQALPGTVGAGEPDPQAPLPALVERPRAAEVDAVLVASIAEGGADSAVVLTRPN